MAWRNYPAGYGNKSKYGANKATVDGIIFDSRREARRYSQLKLLERAGEISDLQLQVKFELIPTQFEEVEVNGKIRRGKCIERSICYYADFVYTDNSTGETVVEDAKGMRTPEYVMKRKLMLYIHGIQIKEV